MSSFLCLSKNEQVFSVNAPEAFLENFTGPLQSDGYAVYQNLTTKWDIKLV